MYVAVCDRGLSLIDLSYHPWRRPTEAITSERWRVTTADPILQAAVVEVLV